MFKRPIQHLKAEKNASSPQSWGRASFLRLCSSGRRYEELYDLGYFAGSWMLMDSTVYGEFQEIRVTLACLETQSSLVLGLKVESLSSVTPPKMASSRAL